MSRPCHLPAESWNAKPGIPVSTPQISSPRFLIASMVGLLTSCAQLPAANPSMPATTAQHVVSLITRCIGCPLWIMHYDIGHCTPTTKPKVLRSPCYAPDADAP